MSSRKANLERVRCKAKGAGFPLAAALLLGASAAAAQVQSDADLAQASLEDLTQMRVTVSSFARRSEDLWTTPAAVFVISADEIAHSAATSIPDLLRVVPGLEVQQINASTWAVTARGFDNQYANKLLVLVDGRNIYSEVFSGVEWDEIDLPLDEIDRIEVIRGPGAAVWGTNAVNGVVNILTRPARAGAGAELSAEAGRIVYGSKASYGGRLGQRAQYHGYVRYLDREPLEEADGSQSYDGESSYRAGGRLTWQARAVDSLDVTADVYRGHVLLTELPNTTLDIAQGGLDPGWLAGEHVLARWEHRYEHANTALQGYYEDQTRKVLGAVETTRTADLDFADHLKAGRRHDLVWGAEARFTEDHVASRVALTTRPEYDNYLVAGFVEDEITLVPNRLDATVGSKIQQGTLAGFQLQPSGRLLWSPDTRQSLWVAASRAAVAPAIQDRSIRIGLDAGEQNGLPVEAVLEGNPAYKPEIVDAFEGGYRHELAPHLALDLAGFYNLNRRLTALYSVDQTVVLTPPNPQIDVGLLYTNGFAARTAGVESTLGWKPSSRVELMASYTWDQAQVRQVLPGEGALLDAWSVPRNSGSLSGWWNFRGSWTVAGLFAYVGALPPASSVSFIASQTPVPAYERLDMHVSRGLPHGFSLDAGGTNLLTPRHVECPDGTNLVLASEIPRSLFVRGKVSF